MSWLFGKKKQQKDSPPDTPPDDDQFCETTGDGMVCIERKPPPPAPYPEGALYPSIDPGVPSYPGGTGLVQPSRHGHEGGNYLAGVPFKLCKRLEANLTGDLEIDALRVSEILSYVDRIKGQNFDYDFALEQGVVAEMSSRDE